MLRHLLLDIDAPFLSPGLRCGPALTEGSLSELGSCFTTCCCHHGSYPLPSLCLWFLTGWGLLLGSYSDRGVLFGTGFWVLQLLLAFDVPFL